MSSSFNNLQSQNQFLQIEVQKFSLKESRSISHDALIDKLEQKNNHLKKQVTKIDRVLSSMKMEDKPRYGLVLPEIKPDALKKQLQNAYKQIKIYEHQIEKRRNKISSEAAYVQQVNKTEKIYKEKVEIHERLKRQMIVIKNQSKDLTKNLKNNFKKSTYENKELTLSTDIKYLQEKLREYEQKRAQHISQLEKQRIVIKQLQQEVLQQNSVEFLENMRTRIFKPDESLHNILSPSRSIIEIQNEAANQQSRLTKSFTMTVSEEPEQKRTESLQSLQNDTKIFKKMHNDYEAKINLIMRQKDEETQKNFRSRNKLLQVEFQIENIEKNILEIKRLIDPKMLKPIHMQPLQKKKQILRKKGPSISHNFKFVQFGQITKNGKRFSDRGIIGKKNSKIIGLTLYQKVEALQFVGIQATYLIQGQKNGRKGNLNILVDPKKQEMKEQNIQLLEGDYFKTIDLFTKKGRIVSISMNSLKNKIIKIGEGEGERNILQMKQLQYPMCIYGSLLKNGFECFGAEIFQAQDENTNSI